jgi:TetR/AcrR family transcriptional repressor of nem operon
MGYKCSTNPYFTGNYFKKLLTMERFFQKWLNYFEQILGEAKEQGIVPVILDTAVTAQALLSYFEGVILLAKGRNDPTLIATLRTGALSLMQYRSAPTR